MDIDFLINPSGQEKISFLVGDILHINGPLTRNMIRRITKSCRMWQLIYCILSIQTNFNVPEILTKYNYGLAINKNTKSNYNDLVDLCKQVINTILRTKNTIMYKLIFGNEFIDNIIQKYDNQLKNGNNYMCIYSKDTQTISHYFTIIKINKNKYYITSSYGSDYVAVPAYTMLFNINDLNNLIDALNDHIEYKDIIIAFYIKYFLGNNLPVYYSSDNIDFDAKLKYRAVENAEMKEIDLVFSNKKNKGSICVGIIPEYEQMIKTYYNDSIQIGNKVSGGYTKHKKTNKKQIKNKYKIHKNTYKTNKNK